MPKQQTGTKEAMMDDANCYGAETQRGEKREE